MRRVAAFMLICAAAVGCDGGGSSAPTETPSTTPASPTQHATVLPVGKSDMILAAGEEYRSPDGFVPVLGLRLTENWHTSHRGADAFDISRPAPDADEPDVAVIFLTPTEKSVAAVVQHLTRRFGTQLASVRLAGAPGWRTTLEGGHGPIVRSRDGTIGLYAARGQRVEITVTEAADGTPLVVVVLVPDRQRWPAVRHDVRTLLGSIEPL